MTTSFIISNTSKYPKCTCTFTEYNDQLLYHDLECQSSVVELVMTFHKRPYLKLLSPEVSAKNAASLAFSLCLIMGGFFSKLVCVLMLFWLLLAGSVSSGVLFAVSTSFSEVLYTFSFSDP